MDDERDSAAKYSTPCLRMGEAQISLTGSVRRDHPKKSSLLTAPKRECWRNRLQGKWRSSSFNQRRVKGMNYSSIVQVPSTKGSRLFKVLVKQETRLVTLTGYNVKVVEKSGMQLARLFQRVYTPRTCHWRECPACANADTTKGPSKCRVNNIVYEAVCMECEDLAKELDKITTTKEISFIGRYIGESSRTLSERSKEHIDGVKNYDHDNFIVKHWVNHHNEFEEAP